MSRRLTLRSQTILFARFLLFFFFFISSITRYYITGVIYKAIKQHRISEASPNMEFISREIGECEIEKWKEAPYAIARARAN